jgi:hypothetical protein
MAQGLSVEDQACISRAVEKVPNNPAIKIERSRVLPQSRAQGPPTKSSSKLTSA